MRKFIYAKLVVEGVHYWPDCNIEEVDYLRHTHRHNFHLTCTKEVCDSDREIEFIELKHQIRDYLYEVYYDYDFKCHDFAWRSCEHIAEELVDIFNLISAEVSEDGECGCVVFGE